MRHSPAPAAPAAEFTIRPNSACNDGSWRWLTASLALVSCVIAIRFAMLGFWMILPFTLLELAVLALALWLMLARADYVEKVLVHENVVEIRHIQAGRDARWRFPRHRARVLARRPRHRAHWYPSRLHIGCAGKWVEIGGCLTDAERGELASAIRRAMTGRR
ncbi:MAG: DUF2244 domain-containing protein [Gammaproteobacteria bacterium]